MTMKHLHRVFNILIVSLLMNLVALVNIFQPPIWLTILFYILGTAFFLLVNINPLLKRRRPNRLDVMIDGYELIILFAVSFTFSVAFNIYCGTNHLFGKLDIIVFVINITIGLILGAVLILNGVLRVFSTSVTTGMALRVLLFFLWWMPIVNLVLLFKICGIVRREYELEIEKQELYAVRKENELCRTKYPILLVHGVFFRDTKFINYWGRIPKELTRNGATLFYGQQESAASVESSGAELSRRIKEIIETTGCEKVNIIAHSKGGLDARMAISCFGMADFVASLTAVSAPHRGCAFADYLLNKAPASLFNFLAKRYNGALKKLGEKNPDFKGAVLDLTTKNCAIINQKAPNMEGVYYQSMASKMKRWTSAKFPQNLSYLLVHPFDPENDGLVSVESARWDNFQMVTIKGNRGISHGDMVDLNRENIRGFDVREFYVDVVKGLKEKGL